VHLAQLIKLIRTNYLDPVNPLLVTFTHPEPNCSDEYYTHFRCPVIFSAETNSLTLPIDVIDKSLVGTDPMLADLSDQVMREYMLNLDQSKLTEQVKTFIIEHLPSGEVRLEKVADDLAVSARTLQRRLNEEDTTFANLLEETRRDLASKYIREKNKCLNEISFLLGFSEVSAFSRAFKRWNGQSPTSILKKQA